MRHLFLSPVLPRAWHTAALRYAPSSCCAASRRASCTRTHSAPGPPARDPQATSLPPRRFPFSLAREPAQPSHHSLLTTPPESPHKALGMSTRTKLQAPHQDLWAPVGSSHTSARVPSSRPWPPRSAPTAWKALLPPRAISSLVFRSHHHSHLRGTPGALTVLLPRGVYPVPLDYNPAWD